MPSGPFSGSELDRAERSLQQLDTTGKIDWGEYRKLVASVAHIPHKEWSTTRSSAATLASIVGGPAEKPFRVVFERVLRDGGWRTAESAAEQRKGLPWVVLVTGLNGIRKTSAVYQTWFQDMLRTALGGRDNPEDLPTGDNSFFRQLDYIVTTVACEELRKLYAIADLGEYAAFKDAIYGRYRTLAEMVGILLVNEAKERKMNVIVETSGRDVNMFKYVDEFFEDANYHKLVLNFQINDRSFAEQSVDRRMIGEQEEGKKALTLSKLADVPRALIEANAGGPYGSAMLADVERSAKEVWANVVKDPAFAHWRKAEFLIHGRDDGDWTARANVKGSVEYTYGPPRETSIPVHELDSHHQNSVS